MASPTKRPRPLTCRLCGQPVIDAQERQARRHWTCPRPALLPLRTVPTWPLSEATGGSPRRG